MTAPPSGPGSTGEYPLGAGFRKAESKKGFPRIGFSDSRCWLGLGASIEWRDPIHGFTGSGGGLCCGGSKLPGDGGLIRGQRCQRCEVVAAVASDGQRGGQARWAAGGRYAAERAGMAVGADRREAGPDLAGAGGRAGRTRDRGELRRGVAVLQAPRDHVQKKACTPASRTGRRRPAAARWKTVPGPA